MHRGLLTTLVALTPVAVLAAVPLERTGGPADRAAGRLERWDTNGDGVVTREEAHAAAIERVNRLFDAVDADADGTVTRDEVRQARESRREKVHAQLESRFRAADTDADGALTREEAEKGLPMAARRFAQLDQDGDGRLTAEELRAQRKPRR